MLNEEMVKLKTTIEVGLMLLRKARDEGILTVEQYQKASKIYQEIAA